MTDPPPDWYWTTLGALVADLTTPDRVVLTRVLKLFDSTVGTAIGSVLSWPVIYKGNEGITMRWIKTIYAGTLGAGEEFQHQINFGHPGADPDPSETECAALATYFATKWQDMLNGTADGLGGAPVTSMFAPDVKYTKVGIVKNTQTYGTAKDGSGGNLEQAFPTSWANINTTVGVTGTATGTFSLPYEVACAVSLHTAHTGPSGRGRTYFPPFTVGIVGAGGNFVGGQVQGLGAALGGFFEDVEGDSALVPVVVSRRRIVLNEVINVTVGIVPDSQRRRRWAMPENPLTAWSKP
jgi:hypothetical protein